MRLRDKQKNRVYKAETVIDERSKQFKSIEECQAYAAMILKDEWFRKQYPHVRRISVTWRKGHRNSCGGRDRWDQPYMKISSSCQFERVVLHELAHGLQPNAGILSEGHGKEFCSIFTRLVYRFMGPEAFRDLSDSFREHRIQYIWMAGSGCGLMPFNPVAAAS